MAFSIPDFEPYKASNPLASALSGYVEGKNAYQKYQKDLLANQLAQKQLPYAEQDIKTTLANRRKDIELKQMKLSNPELFYPPDAQMLSFLKKYGSNFGQAQPQVQPQNNSPNMGPMTLANGGDFSPQKEQLTNGLANNQAPANAAPQNAQGLNLNDLSLPYLAKYNPFVKQQLATQLSQQEGINKGIVSEGEKLGGYRADAINDLDTQYGQLLQSGAAVDHLVDLVKDPTFINMKSKIPFFQDKQLQVLSKIGTPEEQKAIGDFFSSVGNTVASAVQTFKGSALAKEFDLENEMNVSPNDTWGVMVGKLESLETYKEMIMQRNRIASKLMQEKHVNKGDALEQADKLIDGDKIRKQIQNKLKPKSNSKEETQERDNQSKLTESSALLPQVLSNKNKSTLSEKTIGSVTYHKVNGKWLPVKGGE